MTPKTKILLGLAAFAGLTILGRRAASDPTSSAPPSDRQPARLTEYHPDAPPSAGTKVLKREGGPRDRKRQPLITLEQHRSDPSRFPYVSVSSDLVLQGRQVPYGARIYIDALPSDVLRLVDTGGNFTGDDKKIREPGHEPLDIATAWPGGTHRLGGRLTRYRVDWTDVLPPPGRPAVA